MNITKPPRRDNSMDIKYKYEIVIIDKLPTVNTNYLHSFGNPVSIGDNINLNNEGFELLKVIAVEHYPECSVLYCK